MNGGDNMIPISEEQIKREIKAHIAKSGVGYNAWYTGISKNPRDRLFDDHGVREWYIYRQAFSSNAARNVEDYFVNTLGTDGDVGGGDENADCVYAYKKTTHTNP